MPQNLAKQSKIDRPVHLAQRKMQPSIKPKQQAVNQHGAYKHRAKAPKRDQNQLGAQQLNPTGRVEKELADRAIAVFVQHHPPQKHRHIDHIAHIDHAQDQNQQIFVVIERNIWHGRRLQVRVEDQ